MQVPGPLKSLFSHFPLYTHPPLDDKGNKVLERPTIWVHLSKHHASADAVLSSDVECLKWQAYLALRGLSNIRVRFDVDAQGAIDGRLPNLHVPFDASASYSWTVDNKKSSTGPIDDSTELLSAPRIVEWVDVKLAHSSLDDAWEGYKDEAAKDESRAWVSLLEGNVHAALILSQPSRSFLESLLAPPSPPSASLESIIVPPPPPSTGFLSLLPSYSLTLFSPFGSTSNNTNSVRISSAIREAVFEKYADAIKALSERLGTDKWFLGSDYPTPLDALIFAYLHCILQSSETVRTEVTRRVNLVAWELRVAGTVKAAFSRV
ncbi:hypothetical protein J3R30DRAFT_3729779 [Lentinula aciculospora]|uniref:Metaxin glutathione S-transferase domain-containing protein n=1 Tax=Lentinula aciculospora TaxID=153920 RepID=A0A9W9ARE2_9AGAR|nr:hypothetical protein J3R30DRAFT_3729779 [Lentinula aciculospora]